MSTNLMKLYSLTFPDGKKYFGISLNPNRRLSRHRRIAETGKKSYPLYQAIRKHGFENIKFRVLSEGIPEVIQELEIQRIKRYKTADRRFGYNVSPGGTCPMLGRTHTEESRQKMSVTRKAQNRVGYWAGKTFSLETREKMSKARAGRPSPNKGKKMSEDYKQILRAKHKGHGNPFFGKHHSEESKKKIGLANSGAKN